MAKQGEIDFLRNIGEAGVLHAVNKPFSDPLCARYLMEVGLVLSLLPPPPARLLDLGCGTGWTSVFFAKCGYDVVGVDIAPDMIANAAAVPDARSLPNLRFQVSDYEDLRFAGEFDCAVFFDSLHHAVDEQLAIARTYAALKPGGVCVACEPGKGHQDSAAVREAARKWNTTEKDMHPDKIFTLARAAGFRGFETYPRPYDLSQMVGGRIDGDASGLSGRPSLGARLKERVLRCLLRAESPHMRRLRYSQPVSGLMYVLANLGDAGVVRLIK